MFPQRDCIQKPENCNLRYEYITQLVVIDGVNVMQQRLLALTATEEALLAQLIQKNKQQQKKHLTFGVTMRVCRCGFAQTGASLRLLLRSPCC